VIIRRNETMIIHDVTATPSVEQVFRINPKSKSVFQGSFVNIHVSVKLLMVFSIPIYLCKFLADQRTVSHSQWLLQSAKRDFHLN